MEKIKIITDSGSDLIPEEAAQYGIQVLPFPLFLDGKEYASGVDITPAEFFKVQPTLKEFPRTTQITPAQYHDVFASLAEEYTDVVCICLSSKGSGSYNSACLAKQMIEEDGTDIRVTVVDSRGYAFLYGYAAIEGARLANEGRPLSEVLSRINDVLDHYEVRAAVETLEFLKKGGRINAATALLGNLLDIHPVVAIVDGLIGSVDKIRGNKRLIDKIGRIILDAMDHASSDPVIIVQANCMDRAEALKALLAEQLPGQDIWIRDIGPVIGLHTGPGLIGAFFRA